MASRLQVRRDIREYAAANKASVASTCPWARYNFAYFFLGHGPLFSEQKNDQTVSDCFGVLERGKEGGEDILETEFGAVKRLKWI